MELAGEGFPDDPWAELQRAKGQHTITSIKNITVGRFQCGFVHLFLWNLSECYVGLCDCGQSAFFFLIFKNFYFTLEYSWFTIKALLSACTQTCDQAPAGRTPNILDQPQHQGRRSHPYFFWWGADSPAHTGPGERSHHGKEVLPEEEVKTWWTWVRPERQISFWPFLEDPDTHEGSNQVSRELSQQILLDFCWVDEWEPVTRSKPWPGDSVMFLLHTHRLNYSKSTLKLNIDTFHFFPRLCGRAGMDWTSG